MKITPNTPKNESGRTQMIMMGKSIRQIWVNDGQICQIWGNLILTYLTRISVVLGAMVSISSYSLRDSCARPEWKRNVASCSREFESLLIAIALMNTVKCTYTVKILLNARTLINDHPLFGCPKLPFHMRVLEFQEPLINAHFENAGKNPMFLSSKFLTLLLNHITHK